MLRASRNKQFGVTAPVWFLVLGAVVGFRGFEMVGFKFAVFKIYWVGGKKSSFQSRH